MPVQPKVCKVCLLDAGGDLALVPSRPVTDGKGKPYPGPRCFTHWQAEKKRRRKASHENRVANVYNLKAGEYDALKTFQGGTCAICKRAKGISRNLAIDHDHKHCAGKTSCGECIRGALCSPCNSVLAHARDDIEFFIRAVDYLTRPPYRRYKEQLKGK